MKVISTSNSINYITNKTFKIQLKNLKDFVYKKRKKKRETQCHKFETRLCLIYLDCYYTLYIKHLQKRWITEIDE